MSISGVVLTVIRQMVKGSACTSFSYGVCGSLLLKKLESLSANVQAFASSQSY